MSVLIGIDLGTSAVKAGALDESGRLLAFASARYGTHSARPGWAEQDPNLWWRASADALDQLRSMLGTREIAGICVVGQSPTLVCANANGEPTRAAVLWADTRVTTEARKHEELAADLEWFSVLPKAAWVRRHEPAVYRETRWFLQAFDYMAYRMTGEPVVTSTIAGLAPWPDDRLTATGLDPHRIPARACTPGDEVGAISRCAAETLGVAAGTPVFAGTVDSFAAWIGAGVMKTGIACVECGTTGGVVLSCEMPIERRGHGVHSIPHPAGNGWIVGAATSTGSNFVDWCRHRLFGNIGIDELSREAASIDAGCEGLLALPHLLGERAPISDPSARAAFFGIGPHHTRAHFIRAAMEAVAFATLDTCTAIEESAGPITEIRLAGGSAGNEVWNDIRANVLGRRVVLPEVTQAATVGAAILAAVGSRDFASIPEAAGSMVRASRVIDPDPPVHARYRELFETYRGLYNDVKRYFTALNGMRTRAGVTRV